MCNAILHCQTGIGTSKNSEPSDLNRLLCLRCPAHPYQQVVPALNGAQRGLWRGLPREEEQVQVEESVSQETSYFRWMITPQPIPAQESEGRAHGHPGPLLSYKSHALVCVIRNTTVRRTGRRDHTAHGFAFLHPLLLLAPKQRSQSPRFGLTRRHRVQMDADIYPLDILSKGGITHRRRNKRVAWVSRSEYCINQRQD